MQTPAQKAAQRAYRRACIAYGAAWERHHAAIVAQHHGNHGAHAAAYYQRAMAQPTRDFDRARAAL